MTYTHSRKIAETEIKQAHSLVLVPLKGWLTGWLVDVVKLVIPRQGPVTAQAEDCCPAPFCHLPHHPCTIYSAPGTIPGGECWPCHSAGLLGMTVSRGRPTGQSMLPTPQPSLYCSALRCCAHTAQYHSNAAEQKKCMRPTASSSYPLSFCLGHSIGLPCGTATMLSKRCSLGHTSEI